ncbi:MAG: hypothetical protein ACREAN_02635 [Nitrosopumilaceae archaeon]
MRRYLDENGAAQKIVNDEVLKFRASKKWIVAYSREVNASYTRKCDSLSEELLTAVSELMVGVKVCEDFRDGGIFVG